MTKTQNYNLNQWEPTDPIRREDFNADNAAIDAALAASGNCKVYFGSYLGTGTYGNTNKNTLTFDFVPQVIFLFNRSGEFTILRQGVGTAFTADDGYGWPIYLTWTEKSVSWYYSRDAAGQYNTLDTTYSYVVLYS